MSGGVLPVLKHMPGHGRATADSHENLPVVDAAPEDLVAHDIAAFQALADLPLGMTAHVVYSTFDDRPATLSSRMIRLIREEIGFDGFLMTDDISMGALGGSLTDRSRGALAAGCDAVLHCNGSMAEMVEVAAACGALGPDSVERGRRALGARQPRRPIDISALEAELDGLLDGRSDDAD
jgi:beta-N-acetylhexosaminidase